MSTVEEQLDSVKADIAEIQKAREAVEAANKNLLTTSDKIMGKWSKTSFRAGSHVENILKEIMYDLVVSQSKAK